MAQPLINLNLAIPLVWWHETWWVTNFASEKMQKYHTFISRCLLSSNVWSPSLYQFKVFKNLQPLALGGNLESRLGRMIWVSIYSKIKLLGRSATVARTGSRLDHEHIDQRNTERYEVRLSHGPSAIQWLMMPIEEQAQLMRTFSERGWSLWIVFNLNWLLAFLETRAIRKIRQFDSTVISQRTFPVHQSNRISKSLM